jgi:hypothetical protein
VYVCRYVESSSLVTRDIAGRWRYRCQGRTDCQKKSRFQFPLTFSPIQLSATFPPHHHGFPEAAVYVCRSQQRNVHRNVVCTHVCTYVCMYLTPVTQDSSPSELNEPPMFRTESRLVERLQYCPSRPPTHRNPKLCEVELLPPSASHQSADGTPMCTEYVRSTSTVL